MYVFEKNSEGGDIMKVALLTYYLRLKDYPTRYSLAGLRLGEYLRSSGIDVDIVPVQLVDLDFEQFVKENIQGKYDIVGISNYVWARKATPHIARIIRENAKGVSTIIGGPEVEYTDLTKYENEIFILGEGEESLVEAIRYIEQGRKDDGFFENHPNIFDKKHPEREKVEERLMVKSPLFTHFNDIDKDFLYYETSRGCAYNCAYCGFRNRKQVELFDLDIVEEEIKRIGEGQFKEVFVVDANLGGTPERAKCVLDMFNRYAPNSTLTIYLRPEFIDDEMVALLSKANLKEVRIGIQTVNENIPGWIRSNSMRHVTEELPKLSKHGVHWKAEFIIGLPGDDMQGLKKSIDFAENVLRPTEICCYPLTLIKGTPLYSMVGATDGKWVQVDENERAVASFSYTHEELVAMQEYAKERMNNYLKNKSTWDPDTKERKIAGNTKIYKDER